MKQNTLVRYLLCDRATKHPILEFEDREMAIRAKKSLAPIRQEKYEIIPQVICL